MRYGQLESDCMVLKLSTWKMVEKDPGSTMKKDLSYVASSQSGVKWPQFLAGTFAAGGALCSGAIMGWSFMQYDSDFTSNSDPEAPFTNVNTVLVMSMLTLGALQGAFPASFLADILGRKLMLLLVAGLFWITGVLLIVASRAAWLVYMSHFVAGFATGCSSVIIPLYNEEIAETNVRGRIGVMYGIHFCGGVLLSCLMQIIFPNFNVPILHFLLPVLFFLTFKWMPESPVFLVARGKHKRAQQSLQWLRTSKSHPLYDIGAEIHTIETFLENTRFKKMSKYYVEESGNMLCCGIRKGSNILIVCILMLVRPICGAYALISYRNIFFEPAGLSISVTTTIVSATMFLSSFVTLYCVDRFGRRLLLLCSLGGTTVCQVLFAQYFYLRDHGYDVTDWSWVCLVLFIAFLVLFSIGLGPLPWLLMAEYLPAESKRWSTGLACSINWLMTFLASRAFYGFINAIGHTGTFGLLFILNVVAVLLGALFFPETKQCSREETQ